MFSFPSAGDRDAWAARSTQPLRDHPGYREQLAATSTIVRRALRENMVVPAEVHLADEDDDWLDDLIASAKAREPDLRA